MGPGGSPLRSPETPRRPWEASDAPPHPPLQPHIPPVCSKGREITAGQGEMAECQVPGEEGLGFRHLGPREDVPEAGDSRV